MRYDLWHGTNQTFTAFDPKFLGQHTANSASRSAFFLATDPEVAWEYAKSAERNMIKDQDKHEREIKSVLDRAERLSARGLFSQSEALYLLAEDMERRAVQSTERSATLLACAVDLHNPMEVNGQSWNVVTNLGAVIQEARSLGHDGLIIRNIADMPSGAHIADDHFAVFKASAITIEARFSSLEGARQYQRDWRQMPLRHDPTSSLQPWS